jgi:hypothetical protein
LKKRTKKLLSWRLHRHIDTLAARVAEHFFVSALTRGRGTGNKMVHRTDL